MILVSDAVSAHFSHWRDIRSVENKWQYESGGDAGRFRETVSCEREMP